MDKLIVRDAQTNSVLGVADDAYDLYYFMRSQGLRKEEVYLHKVPEQETLQTLADLNAAISHHPKTFKTQELNPLNSHQTLEITNMLSKGERDNTIIKKLMNMLHMDSGQAQRVYVCLRNNFYN